MIGQSSGGPASAVSRGDDHLLMQSHPHWLRMAAPALWLAGSFVPLGLIHVTYPLVTLVLVTIPGIRAAARAVEVRSTSYVVSSRQIGVRRVFVTRWERHISVMKVNDVRLSQGLVQRLAGCGDLVIESSGEADRMVLRCVPGVLHVHAMLTQLIHDEEERRTTPWP